MKIFIDVADTPEKEELVSEVFIDNLQWCELSQEGGKLLLTFLPRPDSAPMEIEFDVAIAILNYMKEYLLDGDTSRPEWLSLE